MDAAQRRHLSGVALALGDAHAARGERAAAREYWVTVLRISGDAALDLHSRTVRAHALWRLGRAQEALTLADNLRSGPYRHPLVLDLFGRVGLPPERKEPA